MKLSDAMVFYRAKHGLTQTQLGELCGLTKQTINQAETERKKIGKVAQAKILLVIGKEMENDTVRKND